MNRENGNMALVLCLFLALAAGVGGIYFHYTGKSQEAAEDDRLQLAYEELQKKAERALANQQSLNTSVERNPNSFACLFSVSGDCAGKGGTFQLFDTSSAGPLSQLANDMGVTATGEGCRGFPSQACPLRLEASWSPVCSISGRCEGTRSAKISVRVMMGEDETGLQIWEKENTFSPTLQLSEAVQCQRGGGVWALTECLTPAQATSREIASGGAPDSEALARQREEAQMREEDLHCPQEIEIQGTYHYMRFIGTNRAEAQVPAMNGCPNVDTFTFQCQARTPEDRTGQWIQVEAQMAPNCDDTGMPIPNPSRE